MYSFLISIVALVLGYLFYGRFLASVVRQDAKNPTPALTKTDGVDYIPMPTWKVFMIQFLNIAGTGPIFGAIMGAKFGPACYLWVVLGCIFAGAVHDYISGMVILRGGGCSYNDMIGKIFGKKTRVFVTFLITALLLLVGAVFVYSPSIILGDIAALSEDSMTSMMFWVVIIFVYYLIASILPIDKLIGKIYPIFAFCILFMALGLFVCLLIHWPTIPEFWDGLANRGPSIGVTGQSIFPCLFITVACGAISGFHATQSPMMARCLTNEKHASPVFYGSMIAEGVVALIWAAVSSYFFFDGGMAEVQASSAQAPAVVVSVSKYWLGAVGSILAIIGVVAAPITTGDTAFRSARIMIADYVNFDQKPAKNRILISIPLFAIAILLLWFNMADEEGFNTIWRYFGWLNQTLAAFTLWAMTQWLYTRSRKMYYLITLLPALFMTAVCGSFILFDSIGLGLPQAWLPYVVALLVCLSTLSFCLANRKQKRENEL